MSNVSVMSTSGVARLAALLLAVALVIAVPPVRSAGPDGPVSLASVVVAGDDDLARLAGFDLAEARHGNNVDVVLWPGDEARVAATGLEYEIVVHDLVAAARANAATSASASGDRTTYRRLAEYEAELRGLADRFPELVRLVEGAYTTYEGRTVLGVEIADGVHAVADGRPTVMFLGLHHAREWPSGELTMDLANDLAESFGVDPTITALLRRVRILVVPVVNPDGFHHSRESLVDVTAEQSLVAGGQGAYWRKNRRGVAKVGSTNPTAYGADPNRNYGHLWGSGGLSVFGTTSANPTEQAYQGEGPFSEPESANVRQWILSRHVTALITNHTYSELILYPWGHTNLPPPDGAALAQLAKEMAAFNGYKAQPGIALYPTTGSTEDWAYAVTGTFGFTFEHGRSFHPSYTATYGKLWAINRPAFLHLIAAGADPARHSVISGDVVPAGATIRLVRSGETPLNQPNPANRGPFVETFETSTVAGHDGRFEWHVNPSTRPIAKEPEPYRLLVSAPGFATRVIYVTVVRGQRVDLGKVALTPA